MVLDSSRRIIITDHAKEKLSIPDSVIKRVVRNDKGMIFYDNKHDSYIYEYNKTSIVVEHYDDVSIVVTCYRDKKPSRFNSDRFEHIRGDVDPSTS